MDSSLAIKPAQNAPAARSARSQRARQAVATDLGADKAVAAAAQSEPSPAIASRPDALLRDLIADPQSREVIFRALDMDGRRRARGERDEEALRRRRAYDRTSVKGAAEPAARRRTDIEA
jgi:hypothetical protein